ncbi:endospore germination permease [Clostridium carnis]
MNKLSSKHFILFIIGVTFISLKTYPSIFIELGGRDTWIAALVASIAFTAYALFVVNVCKTTNTYDFCKIVTNSFSGILGKFLLMIFCINLFLTSIESCAVEANALHSTIFLDTPVWYALIFFLIPSLFLLNKKLRTILIFILVGVFTLLLNSIVLFVLTQRYQEINNLLPVLGKGINNDLIFSALLILGSLSSFVIVLPFMKHVKKYQHIKSHSFYACIITCAIVILSILGVITAFGPIRSSNIFYPEFVLSQRIEVAGFLEFGEMFFIVQIVLGFFIKYILSTYSILLICENIITNKKLFIGIYTFLVFVLSNFLGRNNYILYDILKYAQVINLICYFLIPFIIFITYYIKNNKKNNSNNVI